MSSRDFTKCASLLLFVVDLMTVITFPHNDITGTDVIDDNNDITDNDGPDDIDDDRDWTMGAGGGSL